MRHQVAATFLSLRGLAVTVAAAWEHVGPRNIFNDAGQHGEAGTLADAASPAANSKLIYTGGSNNGASSGVLKTIDGGLHWERKSNGLMDTRISAVLVSPDDPAGGHVFLGTTTGIYESIDFADSWHLINGSATLGRIRTLRVGRIGGVAHLIAAGAPGVGSAPLGPSIASAEFTVAPYPPPLDPEFKFNAGTRFTVSVDPGTGDSVLGACVRVAKTDAGFAGEAFLGSFTNAATIDWERPGGRTIPCATLGLHPTNPRHFIYSNSTWGTPGASVLGNTWGSFDGGVTVQNMGHPTEAFHVAIDQRGRLFTGAEAGAYWSANNGTAWSPFVVNMTSPEGVVTNRIPHDFQGISTGFAGDGVAYPSDQGLFIVPSGGPPETPNPCPNVRPGSPFASCLGATPLINANGDMSNNIAIKLSVAQGNGTSAGRFLVTSMWDWGPVASWDNGLQWPIGDWNPHGPAVGSDDWADVSSTSHALATIRSQQHIVEVQLETKHSTVCGHDLKSNFWLPISTLSALGITLDNKGHHRCGGKTNLSCGSVVINGGSNLTLFAINPSDGRDACGVCNCPLAFFALERGFSLPQELKPGAKVQMSWSPFAGPPAPPMPPPGPPAPPPGPHYPKGGAPSRFGEGGAAHSLGESNHVIMLHYNNIYTSRNGGQNLTYFRNQSAKGILSGLPDGAVAHESNLVWTRKKGSRSVPAGPVYTIMLIPNVSGIEADRVINETRDLDSSERAEEDWKVEKEDESGQTGRDGSLDYTSFGELRDHLTRDGQLTSDGYSAPPVQYLLWSLDFGYSWRWRVLPMHLQQHGPHQKTGSLAVDPTDSATLYIVSGHCVATSADSGENWSECLQLPSNQKQNQLTSLHIKNSDTMVLLRQGAVPLRTTDGAKIWIPLNNFPNVTSPQYSRSGLYSWSGKTLVVYGRDPTASKRGQFPTYVHATVDDGDTWVDWVDDLVTMSPASAVWYERDFYLTSAGEGIMLKRGAEDES